MNQAGLTFELAANIIHAAPVLASDPTGIVDYQDLTKGSRSLGMEDPEGNWLPSDIIPWHIWERKVIPCRKEGDPDKVNLGDISWIVADFFQDQQKNGKMKYVDPDRGEITFIPLLSDEPVYQGEIDPLGHYFPGTRRTGEYEISTPKYDSHIIVVNGQWVFERTPIPSPVERLQNLMNGGEFSDEVSYQNTPILKIMGDRKTVSLITEEAEKKNAMFFLENYDSRLDVNATLAVRKMKRRALGLVRETIEYRKDE